MWKNAICCHSESEDYELLLTESYKNRRTSSNHSEISFESINLKVNDNNCFVENLRKVFKIRKIYKVSS